MKKWQRNILIVLAGLIIVFMVFATIDNIGQLGLLMGFLKIIAAHWLAVSIVTIGLAICGGLICLIIWLFLKERAEKTERAEEIQNLREQIENLKNPKKAEDSEQGAIYSEQEEEIGSEAEIQVGDETPPAPTNKKGPASNTCDEPSPITEAGFINEIKAFITKGNRRIIAITLSSLIILLLLTLGLGFATYKFWQRSNYFKAQSETLQGLVKSCTDTNAFYNILNKQQELMMKFGIPVPESIDPKEVAKWNVDATFVNLYCQFRSNQIEVNKEYLDLLPKFPQAPKCTCNIQACTEGKDAVTAPPTDEKPKAECGDGKCEKDVGENINSCPTDCKPKHFCGDGKCNKDEDKNSCPNDCYEETPSPPKPVCDDGICQPQSGENYINCSDCEDNREIQPMDVYPGCDNQ
ncbi:phage holin family protein [Candidatus Falkowbacteria bacterium]|nr:phage holin family protein [Candidatus Falkowbacteria bacterium]